MANADCIKRGIKWPKNREEDRFWAILAKSLVASRIPVPAVLEYGPEMRHEISLVQPYDAAGM
jgi:hypothetical protein